MTVLLVPFTVGLTLQKHVQEAEDRFVAMVGGSRVRVVEKGEKSCQTYLAEMTCGWQRECARTQGV